MIKQLCIATAVVAATLAPTAAHAVHVQNVAGVDSCAATAPPDETRMYCVFVSTGRQYHLTISGRARHAFARVTCAGPSGGFLFVSKWDTEGDSKTVSGFLPVGLCTLEVASDDESDGDWSTGLVS